nr:Uncharacterised protein [Streptococcus thermophilus]
MKLFLSPFSSYTYLLALAALALAMPLARFLAGDGTAWTVFGGLGLVALFTIGAMQWPAMNQLGTSFRTWLKSAAATAAAVSGVLAVVTTASSVVNQEQNPYYTFYDAFLVVSNNPVEWVDTNGEAYMVEAAAQNAGTIMATFAVTFAFLFFTCLIGVGAGLAAKTEYRWLPIVAAIAAVAAAVFCNVAIIAYSTTEIGGDIVSVPPTYTGLLTITVATLIATAASAFSIARAPRFIR